LDETSMDDFYNQFKTLTRTVAEDTIDSKLTRPVEEMNTELRKFETKLKSPQS